ncbi:plasmid partitioning protein RepB C-terminal domain-containing protein [Sinorhizobium meliloti]|uniref:plasmid partitioning protein RepB C-terminal domain-containing protein n=3 Tax=Rhizobium meliloti TaxID=382 RepID=UPI002351F02C|nr:plasmid partitioning protein RepB C-terminal domain-containing protein [Sinorhizobium meliloti]
MLKDTPCSMKVFDVLRQMNAVRQIEAADLMIGQHNFTLMFARAIRAATPDSQLVAAKKMTGAAASTPPGQQIARMERELAALQTQVKSVEETYGIDNLHLTVARGYVAKLLANTRITRWLSYHRQEYLGEFQKIAEIDPQPEALRVKFLMGQRRGPPELRNVPGLFVHDRIMYQKERRCRRPESVIRP